MTAKASVWIVEWEYKRDGNWTPAWSCPPSRTKSVAIWTMNDDKKREPEHAKDWRYRVRRYIREEPTK